MAKNSPKLSKISRSDPESSFCLFILPWNVIQWWKWLDINAFGIPEWFSNCSGIFLVLQGLKTAKKAQNCLKSADLTLNQGDFSLEFYLMVQMVEYNCIWDPRNFYCQFLGFLSHSGLKNGLK